MTGKDADVTRLRQGIARLEASLLILERPEVHELAVGNPSLYFRGFDVRLDLARLYARLGMKDEALNALEGAQHFAWVPGYPPGLSTDTAFANLRDEPRFRQILNNGDVAARIWKGPASDVPYKEKLSVEERIAGLTQFWSEARANFVYFDHVPELDWNKTYLEFLPKIMAAGTTRDYYRVLMQLAPLLKDGHTNIYPPAELQDSFFARPPLATVLVEHRVLIERVDSPSLAKRVHVGDEIIAIDDVPVHRYAAENIAPYVSSSTQQDRALRTYSYQLLMGDALAPVVLTLRDRFGAERKEAVRRSGYPDVQHLVPFAFRMLPGDVAYFALDHFESDAGVKAFEQELPAILKAKALIIDVRRNGGGSTNYGWEVLSYLSRTPIANPPQYIRVDDPNQRAKGASMVLWKPVFNYGESSFSRPHPQIFTGKVAVLTGPRTFSAGEDFVVAFNSLNRGITVGEATGGSTGQPLMMQLPGGGSARICVKRDLTPEGRDFVGTGLRPDVAAAQSAESVRAGRDLVLERALAALKERPAAVAAGSKR